MVKDIYVMDQTTNIMQADKYQDSTLPIQMFPQNWPLNILPWDKPAQRSATDGIDSSTLV